MTRILLALLLLMAGPGLWGYSGLGFGNTQTWPEIEFLNTDRHFEAPGQTSAAVQFTGKDGSSLYRLECRLGRSDEPDFDYSGDFECRLTSLYSEEAYSTLLTDNPEQSKDWESRGRFFVEELLDDCADYPEYGRLRRFRLRGMALTLGITGLRIGQGNEIVPGYRRPEIKEMTLQITARPDPSAISTIAERVNYLAPPYAHPEDPKDLTLKCKPLLIRPESEPAPKRPAAVGRGQPE